MFLYMFRDKKLSVQRQSTEPHSLRVPPVQPQAISGHASPRVLAPPKGIGSVWVRLGQPEGEVLGSNCRIHRGAPTKSSLALPAGVKKAPRAGGVPYEEKWAVRGSVLEVISGNASAVRWQNANEQGFDLKIHARG